jgi:N-acetylglucosamine-6-phosphate deacetylase
MRDVKLGVEAALVRGELVAGDVEILDGRISRVGLAGGGRGLAVPGFVDLQVNGFGGVDFLEADADGYRRAGEALLQSGVVAYLPTLITAPEEQLVAALREIPRHGGRPRVLGAHLEGPFLSPSRLGAHPAAHRRDPDPVLLQRLLGAGPVRLVTLSPELPGADELIDLLRLAGVTVSLGHSDATAREAGHAFDRGARTVTHLFNAMRPFHHREPGLAGAALAREDVTVQLIVDSVHLAGETVKLAWRAAARRLALVTDHTATTLGGEDVPIVDGAPRRPDGTLAGSALTMLDAVRNLHALGVPLPDALNAASAVPAAVLRLPEVGRLDVGLPADVVVLDDNLELVDFGALRLSNG